MEWMGEEEAGKDTEQLYPQTMRHLGLCPTLRRKIGLCQATVAFHTTLLLMPLFMIIAGDQLGLG